MLSGITQGLESLGSSITQGLSDIVDGLTSLGEDILNGLKSLFLPADDFLDNEVNEIRSRFSFADSIIASASGLINTITASASADEQEPPSIVMDIDIRGTTKAVTVIDMSWYEPYKPYGDQVLGGMIWILDIREQCIRKNVPFHFKQTGASFIKDGKHYKIERKYQSKQAKKAAIDT